MENKEKIFKIGTPDSQWVQLTIFDSGMHLLTLVDKNIKCTVNGNVVTNQYWVHEDDKIEIAGRVFDWNYIKGTSETAFKEVKKSSKGGGLLKFILIAIVLSAVAGAGYWFLKNQDSSDVESSQAITEESVIDTAEVAVEEVPEDSQSAAEEVKVQEAGYASLSVDELWKQVNQNTKNPYALYYLAKHYHNRKLDSNATKFWNSVLNSEGDVTRCLQEGIRKITSERFVFVVLARSYRNLPSDIDPSLKGEIVSMLNKIKNKYPDKYTY